MQFKKSLKDLIENGDKLLTTFNTNNGSPLEKLELLLLKFETSETTEQFNKVKSLRDKLVGEVIPYRGRFRKHEGLLSGVWETQSTSGTASTSAPVVLPRIRKEYDFLKPLMVHSDCTKHELNKFITDSRTWTSKTISEDERKEAGIV